MRERERAKQLFEATRKKTFIATYNCLTQIYISFVRISFIVLYIQLYIYTYKIFIKRTPDFLF